MVKSAKGYTNEPDNYVPSDEQAAEMAATNQSEPVSRSDLKPPKAPAHPYGDMGYGEGARKSLDRLIQELSGDKGK